MNFITSKEKLFIALNETNKVIPIRTTLPILGCVLIKAEQEKSINNEEKQKHNFYKDKPTIKSLEKIHKDL